ncbi:DUF4253 domain-containing protein [Streptomyces sp. NPDC006197]|uniref:DUF4253 domain-containing protein n=1 Tax=Streptomyces sp. NPDC006197 TaxID=3156685 RepID=UPI0033B5BC4A
MPRTVEEAVAAEHFAFCPDDVTQGEHDTLREYAREALSDSPAWSFWWGYRSPADSLRAASVAQ